MTLKVLVARHDGTELIAEQLVGIRLNATYLMFSSSSG
jgi:hypothetical protein